MRKMNITCEKENFEHHIEVCACTRVCKVCLQVFLYKCTIDSTSEYDTFSPIIFLIWYFTDITLHNKYTNIHCFRWRFFVMD